MPPSKYLFSWGYALIPVTLEYSPSELLSEPITAFRFALPLAKKNGMIEVDH